MNFYKITIDGKYIVTSQDGSCGFESLFKDWIDCVQIIFEDEPALEIKNHELNRITGSKSDIGEYFYFAVQIKESFSSDMGARESAVNIAKFLQSTCDNDGTNILNTSLSFDSIHVVNCDSQQIEAWAA